MKRNINSDCNNSEEKEGEFNINIEGYFSRKYEFKSSESCKLPDTAFVSNKWSIENLHVKKQMLNHVKAQLNSFSLLEWSKHTKFRDPSSLIIKYLKTAYEPELLTQVLSICGQLTLTKNVFCRRGASFMNASINMT